MGSGQRKKADTALTRQGNVAEAQTDLSRQLADQSTAWTSLAGNYYQDIIKGGDSLTRAVAPQTNAATQQYALARSKAKEMPLGGSRDRALRSTNLEESSTKSSIASSGIQDAMSKIASMGSSGTSEAMSGYSAAGSGYANISKSYSDMASGKGSSTGALAGVGGGIAAAAIAA
jgi:hypothetical protein